MIKAKDTAQQHIADQREWVKKRHLDDQRAVAAKESGPSGLVDERMLAESMRSVRYQDEGHASGDIIDNAIESGASEVHVIFRTNGSTIQEIAFLDNGSGIDPSFLPHATKWGGSSNDGKRNTFGRFGFGLPSASVNRGRRYEVISRIDVGPFNSVTVDLDNLPMKNGVAQLPMVKLREIPDWIKAYVSSLDEGGKPLFRGGEEGLRTVVVWGSFDKLAWPNRQQSSAKFREHLGITYAGWLNVVRIVVDGMSVDPVDVLFTTPTARWYEIPGYPKADAQNPIKFEVADSNGEKHPISVRFSYLSIAAHDAIPPAEGKGRPPKVRQKIRSEYNGIFVTRNGRFIELAKPSFLTWNVYARQVGVSLDFTPELDELFGVTPDKQTIMFSDRLVKILEAQGVKRAFNALVGQVADERAKAKRDRDAEDESGSRPSERTIAKVLKKDTRRTRKADEETLKEGEQNIREKAKKLSEESGVPEETIVEAQEQLHQERPYRVDFSPQTEDDPFYTPTMDGTQVVLRINTGHPWYRELYGKLGPDQAEFRSGLEMMLWVLAASEIDAPGDTKLFYRAERAEWSRLMANAFDLHPMEFNKVATKEELVADDPEAWAEDATEAEAV